MLDPIAIALAWPLLTLATSESFALSSLPCISAGVMLAADDPTAARREPVLDATQHKQLEEAMHYVLIASPDLAAANLTALFESGASDAQLAGTIDGDMLTDRVETVISRGRHMQTAGPLVRDLEVRIERGRGEMARNPARISAAVDMLGGSMRQALLARTRLLAAGEYAMPQLLTVVVVGKNNPQVAAAIEIMTELRRHAVMPLCAALPQVDASVAVELCGVLGQIGWPTAAPTLLALAGREGIAADVREAALAAYARVGGVSSNLVEAYIALARRYFDSSPALISYPVDPLNNMWKYEGHSGLVPVPVPTEIFGQVMAMSLTWEALKIQPESQQALALFVASDLRRENLLAAGKTDPVYGSPRYSPEFFAMMSGPTIGLDVLSMALDSFDTALALDAISALARTAGSTNLVSGTNRLPIVDCLTYPDRRVRFEAALTLAAASPVTEFPQHTQVVPVLASMVQKDSVPKALIIARSEEDRMSLGSRVQTLGFGLLPGGRDLSEVSQAITMNSGIDLVVAAGGRGEIIDAVRGFRESPLTSSVPIIAIPIGEDVAAVSAEFAADFRTVISQSGAPESAFENAVKTVSQRAWGGQIDGDSALAYVTRAVDALLVISRSSNSSIFDLRAGESALLEALDNSSDSLRSSIAEIVAAIPTPRSQRALMGLSLSSSGEEQVWLLNWTAASARRFGNLLEPGQVAALRALIGESSAANADAAGGLYGALDLSSSQAVKLLLTN